MADGRAELIAVALMGRDTKAPDWDTSGVRILAYKIPADPRREPWPVEVLNDQLHVTHNFWPADVDGDGRPEILVASFEGVSLLKRSGDGNWSCKRVGAGDQVSRPNRGASEVKLGRAGGSHYIATIEPWHGNQVVVYTPGHAADSATQTTGTKSSADKDLWQRRVLDGELKWGHAVWCADLDGDADEELVIGVRDELSDKDRCGLRIYDPQDTAAGRWQRSLFDPGGVAIEDLAVADFDGDGRNDVVGGRAAHATTCASTGTKRLGSKADVSAAERSTRSRRFHETTRRLTLGLRLRPRARLRRGGLPRTAGLTLRLPRPARDLRTWRRRTGWG